MANFINLKKSSDSETKNYNQDIEDQINNENEDTEEVDFKNIKKVEVKAEGKNIKKSRKELRAEKKIKKQIEKDLKNENNKIQKKIPEISNLLDITDYNSFQVKEGVIDTYQISSYDISAMNEYEAKGGILAFTKLLKRYKDNIKIVSMNFPTNTTVQKDYIKKKLHKCKEKGKHFALEKELRRLEAIEKVRSDREYYCFIFAKDKEDLERKRLELLRTGRQLELKEIDSEKKVKILYKLNNMNSKI